MTQDITMIDLFCGAGGSSTGAVDAGVRVIYAVNHWPIAIESHNANHPETLHDCVDIRTVLPSQYPYTDIFWASPSCTNHSLAKGKRRKNLGQLDLWGNNAVDSEEEKSRATMREVYEFAEHHRNPILLVENVVDVRHWQHYAVWKQSIMNLGYECKELYLNAQFFGVPQSRDRYYAVFWLKGNKAPNLNFQPLAYCPHCAEEHPAYQWWKRPEIAWGRYGKTRQYLYRCTTCRNEVVPHRHAASEVIDWSLPTPLICERKTPIKESTLQRIEAGIRKYADKAFLADTAYSGGDHSSRVRDLSQPAMTQTGHQTQALAIPPFLMSYYTRNSAHDEISDPMPYITGDNRHDLVMPPQFIMTYYGQAGYKTTDEPLDTITGVDRHALVDPSDTVQNCGFRMLEPKELKLGMSFEDDYIITGNKRQRVKQIGNAVAPKMAQAIIQRCVESLS